MFFCDGISLKVQEAVSEEFTFSYRIQEAFSQSIQDTFPEAIQEAISNEIQKYRRELNEIYLHLNFNRRNMHVQNPLQFVDGLMAFAKALIACVESNNPNKNRMLFLSLFFQLSHIMQNHNNFFQ